VDRLLRRQCLKESPKAQNIRPAALANALGTTRSTFAEPSRRRIVLNVDGPN